MKGTTDWQHYSHMPLDSAVHSPDFETTTVTLSNNTPMEHETRF